MKKLVAEKLEESDRHRVLFLETEELVFYLAEEAGGDLLGSRESGGIR